MAMALRPIDNALPTTPERPKKQAKPTVLASKLVDFGVNEENKPPSSEVSIDYVSSENLKALSDPDSKFQSLIEGLDSKDWIKVCESLNNARRFALFHSNFLVPNLEKVMGVMIKAMKNPRSALCKTSIMASSDIFKAFGDTLLQLSAPTPTSDSFDQLLLQLLLKASQDKRFVCEEADKALNVMVQSTTPLPLLHKLKQYVSHANLRVRAKAAIYIAHCISKMGMEEIKEFGLVEMAQMAASLLIDRLPEAREAARCIGIQIYKVVILRNEEEEGKEEKKEEDAWQSFCQANLQPIHALPMAKIAPSSQ